MYINRQMLHPGFVLWLALLSAITVSSVVSPAAPSVKICGTPLKRLKEREIEEGGVSGGKKQP